MTGRIAFTLALVAPLAVAASLGAQSRRPITFDDFAAMKAVSDPQLAPDGKTVLYSVRSTDVAANKRASTTYSLPLGGGTARVSG